MLSCKPGLYSYSTPTVSEGDAEGAAGRLLFAGKLDLRQCFALRRLALYKLGVLLAMREGMRSVFIVI